MAQAKLGSGSRFAAIEKKAAASYIKKGKSPAVAKKIGSAIAAKAGAAKFGQKKMTRMAVAGKKK
jgi:hypothetical protein